MSKIEQSVNAAIVELEKYGTVSYWEGTLEFLARGISDSQEFDNVAATVRNLLYCFPGKGMRWGTDGVGYLANKSRGTVQVFRSVETKSVQKCLTKILNNGIE